MNIFRPTSEVGFIYFVYKEGYPPLDETLPWERVPYYMIDINQPITTWIAIGYAISDSSNIKWDSSDPSIRSGYIINPLIDATIIVSAV